MGEKRESEDSPREQGEEGIHIKQSLNKVASVKDGVDGGGKNKDTGEGENWKMERRR